MFGLEYAQRQRGGGGYILVSLSESIMNDFHNVGHTGVRYVSTQM